MSWCLLHCAELKVRRFLESGTILRHLLEEIKYVPGEKFLAQFLFYNEFFIIIVIIIL